MTVERICAELNAGLISVELAVRTLREREEAMAGRVQRIEIASRYVPAQAIQRNGNTAAVVAWAFEVADAILDYDALNPRRR